MLSREDVYEVLLDRYPHLKIFELGDPPALDDILSGNYILDKRFIGIEFIYQKIYLYKTDSPNQYICNKNLSNLEIDKRRKKLAKLI